MNEARTIWVIGGLRFLHWIPLDTHDDHLAQLHLFPKHRLNMALSKVWDATEFGNLNSKEQE